MRNGSIALLSGGLDSVYSFLVANEETDIIAAVTFDYGQRAFAKEKNAAQKICQKYDIAHKTISLPFLKEVSSNNPLANQKINLPTPTRKDLDKKDFTKQSAKAVWVPNRNGVFVNIAATLAEANLANRVYVGFNAEEAKTFPDNSLAYVQSLNKSFRYSTMNHVEIYAPSIKMTKKDIVAKLLAVNFDFQLLWSCYQNLKKMCGLCESCMRLKRALFENQRDNLIQTLFLNP